MLVGGFYFIPLNRCYNTCMKLLMIMMLVTSTLWADNVWDSGESLTIDWPLQPGVPIEAVKIISRVTIAAPIKGHPLSELITSPHAVAISSTTVEAQQDLSEGPIVWTRTNVH